jgi:hypothetical protein
MEWIKGNLNIKDKTPEQKLAIAVIQTNFEDAFGLNDSFLVSSNKQLNMKSAKQWFESGQCDFWCDCAGTTGDHVRKLFNALTERFNSGKISIKDIKFAILRLELKL